MIAIKLIFIFLSTLLFIKLLIKNATSLRLTDIPNERSSHDKVTPRGAGIGFGFAFFISILLFDFSLFVEYWLLFLGIFIVFLVGILDDYQGASPKAKFYAIFLATFLLFLNDISIYSLGSFFGFELSLWYFALPFTMFALAGFTNALNLIDGLDGLATSVAIVILSSFLYIGYIYDNELIMVLSSLTIASLLAFLIFNWNPAKIFMGDSGSLFLGFIISVIACLSLEHIHPIAILYLAALPIVDTIVVMVRRLKKGISPSIPDKTHVHHIMLKFFSKKVKKTVLFLVLVQSLFSLVGIILSLDTYETGQGPSSFIALVAFVGITILIYMILTGMKRRQKLIEKLIIRKKNSI